jgi:hypothetical protein
MKTSTADNIFAKHEEHQFPWSQPADSGTKPILNASPSTTKSECEIIPVLFSEGILLVLTERESNQPTILPRMRIGDICTFMLNTHVRYFQHRTERSAPGTSSSSPALATGKDHFLNMFLETCTMDTVGFGHYYGLH